MKDLRANTVFFFISTNAKFSYLGNFSLPSTVTGGAALGPPAPWLWSQGPLQRRCQVWQLAPRLHTCFPLSVIITIGTIISAEGKGRPI
jgi:hypothetical protein